ncbi:MAG: Holliday junction branch migration protein RuvA [Pseudomonadota bacterium]
MIGRLAGTVAHRGVDHALIDVNGVGYVVHCSERVLAALPGIGQPVALYTDLLVREDLLQLFGFQTLAEREWHRLLTSVQGVGAKASLAILGALGAEGLARAVALGDAAAIQTARGVGPKTAQRVAAELKDKAPAVMALGAEGQAPAVAGAVEASPAAVVEVAAPVDRDPGATADALSALLNLGYGQGDAAAAVATASAEAPEADASALIRAALRHLAPAG